MPAFTQYKYHHKISSMRDVAVDTFPMDNLMTTSCELRIYFARKNLLLLQKLEIQKGKQYYATQVYDVCDVRHL